MYLRTAQAHELDAIYAIGFDVWHEGLCYEQYLAECRSSKKYQAGTWYVLIDNEQIVSSLIVYHGLFGLKEGSLGIGSVATPHDFRGQGYASHLIRLLTTELLNHHGCNALFLHSDIDPKFYARLGFVQIEGSNCMYLAKDAAGFDGSLPSYF